MTHGLCSTVTEFRTVRNSGNFAFSTLVKAFHITWAYKKLYTSLSFKYRKHNGSLWDKLSLDNIIETNIFKKNVIYVLLTSDGSSASSQLGSVGLRGLFEWNACFKASNNKYLAIRSYKFERSSSLFPNKPLDATTFWKLPLWKLPLWKLILDSKILLYVSKNAKLIVNYLFSCVWRNPDRNHNQKKGSMKTYFLLKASFLWFQLR